ncbi:hypothetical protein BD309DRAFT_967677 [Dichomitus squalens]|uniref:Uncharacterized protein n=1 Tax=Dichomitus squalens TaxID=114155 RepID=A0A4Q9Q5K9_9APHY|nr:uncharacterized protein DICSQDRAFT_45697 [Dichomitus squalens LYAD-421 SS1]EJF67266.1 hypothetical protein DICSQDRAFT_45697 [Dichomitus squalens LYAD-421 SS1]TBU29831.1 hypothetical protein BD311DRAFT_777278 [Dichomitus squalens]TBU40347.1 hypothetical protein BD309DRAFT_967677 [Dichomitus squalens]TBU62575.1 hypothetical protein BD310DRAFT_810841 [Dichomitus squalens]
MSQTPKTPPKPAPKQPEFKFRTKPVAERSIWESWAVLPAKTRLRISLAITTVAAIGIWASDKLEEAIPAPKDAAKTPQSPSPNAA